MPTLDTPSTRAPRILVVLALPLLVLAIAVAQGGSAAGDTNTPTTAALPVTETQIERGAEGYAQHCALCHGPELEGSDHFPTLKGSTFQRRWVERTLGELYTYVNEQMPLGAGGSLEDATYTDIVAFLLSRNDVEPGETAFDPENEAQRELPLAQAGWDTEADP